MKRSSGALTVEAVRRQRSPRARRRRAPREPAALRTGWLQPVRGAPLWWKLLAANAVIFLAAGTVLWTIRDRPVIDEAPLVVAVLATSLLVNLALVRVALRPLTALEGTARRIAEGDVRARLPALDSADRDIARVGRTLNGLVDTLQTDRQRMRQLAATVIRAQDEEHARFARELHDSTAQLLAAAMLQLGAASNRVQNDVEMTQSLETLRGLVGAALEQVRTLSYAVHPRVLDDLGLVPALESVVRQTSESTGVAIGLEAAFDGDIASSAAAVIYRVAREALRNAVVHGRGSSIRVWITNDDSTATLEVVDDGRGFDVAAAEARRPGMGIFAMRERVALVGGTLEIDSRIDHGTRVTAIVPLQPPTDIG